MKNSKRKIKSKIKRILEKKARNEIEYRREYAEYKRKNLEAARNFKKHIHAHTAFWVVGLLICIGFISAAMMFVLKNAR